MSDLLSFLDKSAYDELVKVVKDNFEFNDREVDEFLEEVLRQYIERREVSTADFNRIVNNALSKVRILEKLAKRGQIIKSNKAYDNLYNKIRQTDKNKLNSAFVYCYIKSKLNNARK